MNNFHTKGYIGVKEIVSKEVIELVSQYCLLDEMFNFNEEEGENIQVNRMHSKYADLLMESLLTQLQPKIEYVTEMELIPTYSYYRIYRPGSILKRHIDRPACEVSASISFNYFYEDKTDILKWPIFFDQTPMILDSGDAVIYKGTEVPHWRDEFQAPKLSYHIQGFFHYVNKNGPYVDHALDKRICIGGEKKKSAPKKLEKSYLTTIS